MKIRYCFDVQIPDEDYRGARDLHVELQGALAEVLQEAGLRTEGLQALRLDPAEPPAPGRQGAQNGSTKPLMNWIGELTKEGK